MSGLGSDFLAERASSVFRTLDTDLCGGGGGTKKRVCIATPDILGPVKNGGIGTAYHHLARLLAQWGHEVVIAYVNGNAGSRELMAKTEAFYAGFGVAFEPIVPRPVAKTALARVSAPTWALLDWLRACERPFDIVHVSEWHVESATDRCWPSRSASISARPISWSRATVADALWNGRGQSASSYRPSTIWAGYSWSGAASSLPTRRYLRQRASSGVDARGGLRAAGAVLRVAERVPCAGPVVGRGRACGARRRAPRGGGVLRPAGAAQGARAVHGCD